MLVAMVTMIITAVVVYTMTRSVLPTAPAAPTDLAPVPPGTVDAMDPVAVTQVDASGVHQARLRIAGRQARSAAVDVYVVVYTEAAGPVHVAGGAGGGVSVRRALEAHRPYHVVRGYVGSSFPVQIAADAVVVPGQVFRVCLGLGDVVQWYTVTASTPALTMDLVREVAPARPGWADAEVWARGVVYTQGSSGEWSWAGMADRGADSEAGVAPAPGVRRVCVQFPSTAVRRVASLSYVADAGIEVQAVRSDDGRSARFYLRSGLETTVEYATLVASGSAVAQRSTEQLRLPARTWVSFVEHATSTEQHAFTVVVQSASTSGLRLPDPVPVRLAEPAPPSGLDSVVRRSGRAVSVGHAVEGRASVVAIVELVHAAAVDGEALVPHDASTLLAHDVSTQQVLTARDDLERVQVRVVGTAGPGVPHLLQPPHAVQLTFEPRSTHATASVGPMGPVPAAGSVDAAAPAAPVVAGQSAQFQVRVEPSTNAPIAVRCSTRLQPAAAPASAQHHGARPVDQPWTQLEAVTAADDGVCTVPVPTPAHYTGDAVFQVRIDEIHPAFVSLVSAQEVVVTSPLQSAEWPTMTVRAPAAVDAGDLAVFTLELDAPSPLWAVVAHFVLEGAVAHPGLGQHVEVAPGATVATVAVSTLADTQAARTRESPVTLTVTRVHGAFMASLSSTVSALVRPAADVAVATAVVSPPDGLTTADNVVRVRASLVDDFAMGAAHDIDATWVGWPAGRPDAATVRVVTIPKGASSAADEALFPIAGTAGPFHLSALPSPGLAPVPSGVLVVDVADGAADGAAAQPIVVPGAATVRTGDDVVFHVYGADGGIEYELRSDSGADPVSETMHSIARGVRTITVPADMLLSDSGDAVLRTVMVTCQLTKWPDQTIPAGAIEAAVAVVPPYGPWTVTTGLSDGVAYAPGAALSVNMTIAPAPVAEYGPIRLRLSLGRMGRAEEPPVEHEVVFSVGATSAQATIPMDAANTGWPADAYFPPQRLVVRVAAQGNPTAVDFDGLTVADVTLEASPATIGVALASADAVAGPTVGVVSTGTTVDVAFQLNKPVAQELVLQYLLDSMLHELRVPENASSVVANVAVPQRDVYDPDRKWTLAFLGPLPPGLELAGAAADGTFPLATVVDKQPSRVGLSTHPLNTSSWPVVDVVVAPPCAKAIRVTIVGSDRTSKVVEIAERAALPTPVSFAGAGSSTRFHVDSAEYTDGIGTVAIDSTPV